jgi:bacterioferritin-associated ferredoxin
MIIDFHYQFRYAPCQMLVCHCKQVSDHQIRDAIRAGARTRVEIAQVCAAGTRCGGCRSAVEEIVAHEAGPQAATHLEHASAAQTPALG